MTGRARGQVLLGLGWLVAAGVLFAALALVGFELASRDRVLPGVRVLDVPVGGLSPDASATRLTPRTTAILDQPVAVQAADRTWTTSPRALGLRVDPTELASVAYAVGHTGSPVTRLREQLAAVSGETNIAVTATSDGSAVDDLLARVATEINHPARAAALDLTDAGALTYQESQPGLELDRDASRAAVARGLAAGQPTIPLATRTLAPAIATDQVAAAHTQLAGILNNPVSVQLSVSTGQQHWTISRSELLQMLSLSQPGADGSPASLEIADAPVAALVQRIAGDVDAAPQDARFSYAGGELKVIRPGRAGQALDQTVASQLIKTRILAADQQIELPVTGVPPAVASDAATSLKIDGLIDESTTAFAGAIPEKAHNIQLAAERLNGVVVPPGGTFSFNKEVGPTTLEAGFQWGFGLTTGTEGGVHTVPSVAGGICQVATTLFQPVFWAGYQLEERYWHLYWIPSYTSRGVVGLDATVDADAGLDFKWINPTSQPVLIQSSTDAEHVTFRLYGTRPAWKVQVEDPLISNKIVADPTPEVQAEPALPWGRTLPVESARDGFDVLLVRHVVPTDGSAPRDLSLKSTYAPAHTVTLVGSGGAPDAGSVAAAVERLRQAQHAVGAGSAASANSAPPAAPPAPKTYPTPNGPRTLAQIRDELSQAGWGGGSDQDALETYTRVAAGT